MSFATALLALVYPCVAIQGFVGLGPTPSDRMHLAPLIYDPDAGSTPWWSNYTIGLAQNTFLPFVTTTGGPCPACALQLLVEQDAQLSLVILPALGAANNEQIWSQLPFAPSTVHGMLPLVDPQPGGPGLLLLAARDSGAGTPVQRVQLDVPTGKVVTVSTVAGLFHNPDLSIRLAALSPQGVLLCRLASRAPGGVDWQLTELYHLLDNGTTLSVKPNMMVYGMAVVAGTGYLVGTSTVYTAYQLYLFELPALRLSLVGVIDTYYPGQFSPTLPFNIWPHTSSYGPSLAFSCLVTAGRQVFTAIAFANLTLKNGSPDIGHSWFKALGPFFPADAYTHADCEIPKTLQL